MQALYIEQSPYIISIVYWTVHPIIGISVHQCRQPYLWPTHSPANGMAVTIWTVHPQSTMSWNLAKCRLPETWLLSRQIVLTFCTRHGINTAVLCAKFQEGQSTNEILQILSSRCIWWDYPYFYGPKSTKLTIIADHWYATIWVWIYWIF